MRSPLRLLCLLAALSLAACSREFTALPVDGSPQLESLSVDAAFAGQQVVLRGKRLGGQSGLLRVEGELATLLGSDAAGTELTFVVPDLGDGAREVAVRFGTEAGLPLRYLGPGHPRGLDLAPVVDLAPLPTSLAVRGPLQGVALAGLPALELALPDLGASVFFDVPYAVAAPSVWFTATGLSGAFEALGDDPAGGYELQHVEVHIESESGVSRKRVTSPFALGAAGTGASLSDGYWLLTDPRRSALVPDGGRALVVPEPQGTALVGTGGGLIDIEGGELRDAVVAVHAVGVARLTVSVLIRNEEQLVLRRVRGADGGLVDSRIDLPVEGAAGLVALLGGRPAAGAGVDVLLGSSGTPLHVALGIQVAGRGRRWLLLEEGRGVLGVLDDDGAEPQPVLFEPPEGGVPWLVSINDFPPKLTFRRPGDESDLGLRRLELGGFAQGLVRDEVAPHALRFLQIGPPRVMRVEWNGGRPFAVDERRLGGLLGSLALSPGGSHLAALFFRIPSLAMLAAPAFAPPTFGAVQRRTDPVSGQIDSTVLEIRWLDEQTACGVIATSEVGRKVVCGPPQGLLRRGTSCVVDEELVPDAAASALVPDGRGGARLYSGDRVERVSLTVRPGESCELRREAVEHPPIPVDANGLVATPDGRTIAFLSGGRAHVARMGEGSSKAVDLEALPQIGRGDGVQGLHLSADGRWLIVEAGVAPLAVDVDGCLAGDCRADAALDLVGDGATAFTFSPDGTALHVGTYLGRLHTFSTAAFSGSATGRTQRFLPPSRSAVTGFPVIALQVDPTGSRLLFAHMEADQVWEAR